MLCHEVRWGNERDDTWFLFANKVTSGCGWGILTSLEHHQLVVRNQKQRSYERFWFFCGSDFRFTIPLNRFHTKRAWKLILDSHLSLILLYFTIPVLTDSRMRSSHLLGFTGASPTDTTLTFFRLKLHLFTLSWSAEIKFILFQCFIYIHIRIPEKQPQIWPSIWTRFRWCLHTRLFLHPTVLWCKLRVWTRNLSLLEKTLEANRAKSPPGNW